MVNVSFSSPTPFPLCMTAASCPVPALGSIRRPLCSCGRNFSISKERQPFTLRRMLSSSPSLMHPPFPSVLLCRLSLLSFPPLPATIFPLYPFPSSLSSHFWLLPLSSLPSCPTTPSSFSPFSVYQFFLSLFLLPSGIEKYPLLKKHYSSN